MPNDARSVFLSYARRASQKPVDRLHAALGGERGLAFLDRTDIPYGTPIPSALAGAILGARVVVVFFEPVYFTRWYCRLEYRLATALFDHDPELAARHVVLALPDAAARDERFEEDSDELPAALRGESWPAASSTAELADLVRQRLGDAAESIGGILDRLRGAGAARAILTGPAVLPQPLRFGTVPRYPAVGARGSLRDGFVGRDDALWRLHQDLAPAEGRLGHAALTAALKGMGGVGKTQLAAEYFHRYGPRHYTGGLFWLDARRDAAEQHHAVLRALGDTEVGDDFVAYRERVGAARVAPLLGERLAGRLRAVSREHPVLLVVDDVPEQGKPTDGTAATLKAPPLETWCPAPDAAACLATSRAVVGFRDATKVERRTVDVLAPEAAVTLLTQEVPDASALAPAEWREVAEWVGRLPLALAVLNRALRPDARAIYPRRLLEAARAGGSAARYQDAVAGRLPELDATLRGATAAFRLSFDGLSEPAQQLARRLACLGTAPIPLELAEALGPERDGDHVLPLLLARSFVLPPDEVRGAADAQANAGVSHVPMYGRMHALLSDAVRTFSPDRGADVRAAIAGLGATFGTSNGRDPATWLLLTATVPHALAVVARADAVDGPSGPRGLHDVSPAGSPSIDLLLRIGILAHARGDYAAARTAFERAQTLAECLLGPEHPGTLTSVTNLATTLRDLGDLTGARALHARMLAARTRVLGPEHPDTLVSAGNLAHTLWSQGDLAGARTLEERVLASLTHLLGAEHRDTLTAASNLAETLRALGDLAGARAQQEHVLAAYERVLGPEHPDTLTGASNLALTLREQGDLTGARSQQERVLAIRTRVLGPEHPDTLTGASNLAATLAALGDLTGARSQQERVLAIRTRVLGPEHPDTLTGASNLAATLRALGDLAGARSQQERVLATLTQLLGPEHPDTLASAGNLADTLHALGDPVGARMRQERVLASFTRALGAEHPSTLTSANNLAVILWSLGDRTGAQALLESVVAGRTRGLGPTHPDTVRAARNLASIRRARPNDA